jgi:hypothetical protein
VRPVPFLTAPEAHPILSPAERSLDATADRYYAWANRLRVDGRDYTADLDVEPLPWNVHHVLGEASSVQDDVRGDDESLSILLSLHYDDSFGLEILDAGAYTVLIRSADLDAGAFDRTVCAVESC